MAAFVGYTIADEFTPNATQRAGALSIPVVLNAVSDQQAGGYNVTPQGAPPIPYMKRARDSGAPAGPAVYVAWQVTDLATAFPGVLPHGGPLVDTVHWRIG